MLLTLSDNTELLRRFEAIYFSESIFSLFSSVKNASNFVEFETKAIDFVIIDASASLKEARMARNRLRSVFPCAKIVFWASKPLSSDRNFTLSSIDEILNFVGEIAKKRKAFFDDKLFKIVPHDTNARLLGYPLRLTKNEHKILLLLASETGREFSCSEILSLAFPFSQNLSNNQLAVHICNINKKAALISGRKLILNPHKNGYVINPEL